MCEEDLSTAKEYGFHSPPLWLVCVPFEGEHPELSTPPFHSRFKTHVSEGPRAYWTGSFPSAGQQRARVGVGELFLALE